MHVSGYLTRKLRENQGHKLLYGSAEEKLPKVTMCVVCKLLLMTVHGWGIDVHVAKHQMLAKRYCLKFESKHAHCCA